MADDNSTSEGEDIQALDMLLERLDVPFLDVTVPLRGVDPDDEVINVYVKPKEMDGDTDIRSLLRDGSETSRVVADLHQTAAGSGKYTPTGFATMHLFAVLKELAEPDSFVPYMGRGGPLNHAQGHTRLRIGPTQFNVHYTENTIEPGTRVEMVSPDGTSYIHTI